MKINEVEARVGITKKNIRFYEEQGLLSPGRNRENGYRDYGQEELDRLQRIKLLRKLGIPIEEIRRMLSGIQTLDDGMSRHLVTLEREQKNLSAAVALCREIRSAGIPLEELDSRALLEQMEQMEKQGATFRNKQTQDVGIRYVAPVLVTLLMLGLMSGLAGLILWGYTRDPAGAPPWWCLGLLWGLCFAVMAGAVLALGQRVREIGKGEIEDAKRY